MKAEFFSKYPVCECCDIFVSMQIHHCIFGQRKQERKAVRDWLHNEINLQATCVSCNVTTRQANQYSNRVKHIKKRMAEGYDVAEWLLQAPDKWQVTSEFKQLVKLAKG